MYLIVSIDVSNNIFSTHYYECIAVACYSIFQGRGDFLVAAQEANINLRVIKLCNWTEMSSLKICEVFVQRSKIYNRVEFNCTFVIFLINYFSRSLFSTFSYLVTGAPGILKTCIFSI